ncbi:hypothetical protein [Aurantimonas sp. Leaf443]|uniref:hypothetical protein n=1 Tax=Aurantimonas sp. Leaf443 TaxID=1736378 RepID=UPI0006F78FCE|nr:hypothetical protein [Aurantimonas sp. Leaf443]KQT88221.1 hypothetical protein ASG48_01945 [Aurantimonas sp. Leaf443]
MTDAQPRLYRSLETNAGRDGFDTIVAAAAATYASLRNPSEAQARDFGRLAAPLWSRIAPETQRTLAAALSRSPRVPRALVERLLAAPVEVSAPFLLASPCLTATDLATMAIEGDARHAEIAARRRSGRAGLANAPQATGDVAPPLPEAVEPSQPPVSETLQPAPQTAAETREALRRMVRPGRLFLDPGAVQTIGDLVGLARSGDGEGVYRGIAHLLAVPEQRIAAMREEAEGRLLAFALKALHAGPADALTIVMLMKPSVGRDVEAFEALRLAYRTLEIDACRAALSLPARPAGPAPSLAPRLDDLGSRERHPHRRVFGRRPGTGQADGNARSA